MEVSLTIPEELFEQIEALAQACGIAQSELLEIAITKYITEAQSQTSNTAAINQGDIYWMREDDEKQIPHPYVVIQDNLLNHSRIHTVVVCALTSNLNRASIQGNVLLEANEGNLPKQSVIEISKLSSVDKAQLAEYIGTLSEKRVKQILAGLRFLQSSFFSR